MKKVIKITLSNKLFYTLIIIGILGIVAVGVYAAYPSSGAGHNVNEIDFSEGIDGNLIVNGKIGIGTDNPGVKLNVAGKIRSSSTTGPQIEIYSNDADAHLRFHDPNNYWYSMGIDRSDSGKFKIGKGGTIGDANYFVMDYNGNIGIGTATPSVKLDVDGKIKANELCFGDDCKSSWEGGDEIHFGNVIMWSHTVAATFNSCSYICSSQPGVNSNSIECTGAWTSSGDIIDCILNVYSGKTCACRGIASS